MGKVSSNKTTIIVGILILLAVVVPAGWYLVQLQTENNTLHEALQHNHQQMKIFQEDLKELKHQAANAREERVEQERKLQFKIVELRRHNEHLLRKLKYTQYDFVERSELLASQEERLESLTQEIASIKKALQKQILENRGLQQRIASLKKIRTFAKRSTRKPLEIDPMDLLAKESFGKRLVDIKKENLFKIAEENLGKPYVWGAIGPSAFDCSGFTSYVYNKLGVHIPRTARQQAQYGELVDKSALKTGDLVFFDTDFHREGIDHVGIYIGGNRFIHASSAKKKVIVTSMDKKFYSERFRLARRIN